MSDILKAAGVLIDRMSARWQRIKLEQEREQQRGQREPELDDYERYKRGEMSLEDLRQATLDTIEEVREEISDLRSDRKVMKPADYRDQLEELEDKLEKFTARLGWIDDRTYKQGIEASGFESHGKWARFEYIDADGTSTKRSITMWERRGPYIVGYDRDRKAERTFRQDRIEGWISG